MCVKTQEVDTEKRLENSKALLQAVTKSAESSSEQYEKNRELAEKEYMRGVEDLQTLYEKKLSVEQEVSRV